MSLKEPKVPFFTLLLIWAFVSLFNINKAFHVDDTFHLEAAQWIENHPTTPMSGEINWRDDPAKLYTYNQPPLYFYFVAGVGHLFGYDEVPLHIFQSFFTLLAIFAFYFISRRLYPKQALYITALFTLGPSFIVNQNLMTDMPLLSLMLLFIHSLLKAEAQKRHFIYAALLLSAMLLIKYTALPLVILLIIALIYSKSYKQLWVILLPLTTLSAWSLFNVYEFGEVHLFNRPGNPLTVYHIVRHIVLFSLCFGAITPVLFLLLDGYKSTKITKLINWLAPTLFISLGALTYWGGIDSSTSDSLLRALFIINGVALCVVILINQISHLPNIIRYPHTIILLWVCGLGTFTVLFAPFIATRHIILFLPGILLLAANLIEKASPFARKATLIVTICMGAILGISDWYYADFYRQKAKTITLPKGGKSYSLGHWGWQWYTQQIGMKPYATSDTLINIGDYLIEAKDACGQRINTRLITKEIASHALKSDISQFISVNQSAAFYSTFLDLLPWRFSEAPVDTIVIYEVIDITEE